METNQISTAPLVKEVVLDAPVHRVWKALTNNDDMKQWYFELPEFKAEPGFEFQFYGGKDEKQFLHLCKVKEVEENKKISYTWTYESYPEAVTLVTWELFPEGNKTRLKLTHEGLEKLPQDPDFAIDNFKAGWSEILGNNLKNFVGVLEHKLELTTDVNASSDKVWDVLLKPEYNRQWGAEFMEGIYVESDWQKNSEVLWKDKDGNVFVKGIVLLNIPEQKLEVGFYDDPAMSAPDKIGNYKEVFTIGRSGNDTRLTINSGPVSKQDSNEHEALWNKALKKMKELAEQG